MNTQSQSLCADLMGYSPPLCLWKLVEQHVSPHEREEVKSLLGICAVEETLDLHSELSAYLEIWRDCHHLADMRSHNMAQSRLPEPPGMRDRLVQEIKFFVENVKEKASESGREESSQLKRYNQKVLDYAIQDESRPSSSDPFIRPASVMGQDGKETPSLRQESPTSDRMSTSTYSTLSEDVEGMADRLNILRLDEVVTHLRSYLEEEKEYLIQDLKFMQQCIEEENAYVALDESKEAEPSIAELRQERLKLEKDMLSDVFIQQKPLRQNLAPSPKMRSTIGKVRKPVVPQTGPVKAVHTSAPDGIVLSGNVPDSVVVKTQQKLLNEAKNYVQQDGPCTTNSQHSIRECATVIEPCIRPDTPGSRPSSALKFRSMVMSSRAGGD